MSVTTPSTTCTIFVNDRAGALHATAGETQLRQMAQEIGLRANVVATTSPSAMQATIRRLVASGAERVAVAGGDGTVALAVQELAHTNTVLGILPQGTANNFATALRLPQDLPSALRVLAEGVVQRVDLGKVGDCYFTEAAGVGLFADALALYGPRANKNFVRTLYAVTRLFFSVRARRVRLMVDGELHSERAVLCEAANTFRIGHAVPIAPGARLTDGLLDVIVAGDLKQSELIPYYRAFRAQLHSHLPKMSALKGREIRIESRHTMNVHCDDRVVGTTPVTITAQPGALQVLVEPL